MIRPGKMRHVVTIQRATLAPDAYGNEVETWADVATLRAEVVADASSYDAEEAAGTAGRRAVTFKTRLFAGVALTDRVQWCGAVYRIIGLGGADFAEGRALELQCEGAP